MEVKTTIMKTPLFLFLFFIFIQTTLAQPLAPKEDSALVEVVVSNMEGKVRANDRIHFEGQKTKVVIRCISDQTGKFVVYLPEGDTYLIQVKGLSDNQKISTITVPKSPGKYAKATLQIKYEPTKIFTLKNVNFETGKSTLLPESSSILDTLIELLQTKSTMRIELSGHTDDIGNEEANAALSLARAKEVKKYLCTTGRITNTRIEVKGYGEEKPIADNSTEEGRQANRRTEVTILEE